MPLLTFTMYVIFILVSRLHILVCNLFYHMSWLVLYLILRKITIIKRYIPDNENLCLRAFHTIMNVLTV